MSLFITEAMPPDSTVGDAISLIEKLSRKHGWELDDLLVEGPIGFMRTLRAVDHYHATPVRADGHNCLDVWSPLGNLRVRWTAEMDPPEGERGGTLRITRQRETLAKIKLAA